MEQAEPRAPILRQGLEFRPISGDQVYAYHPEIATQILDQRISEALQLCRGQTLEEMLPEVRSVLDYDCTAEEWAEYLTHLAQFGFFEGTTNRTPRRFLFDPGPAMEFLMKRCRWLFTPPILVAIFLALLAGLWELMSHWSRFAGDVMHYTGAHPFLSLPLFYFCFVPVGLLHELAHGVVCRWYGGEVLEVGVHKDTANFYVLTNKTMLTEPRALMLYLAGGAFLDMVIFLFLVSLWLAWPNYLTFMFLFPQAMFVLQFSYAMEGGSDLSKIISVWTGIRESEGRWAFVKEFFSSRPKTAPEWRRAAVYWGSILLQGLVAAFLIWSFRQPTRVSLWPGFEPNVPFWPPLLYLMYRVVRYAAFNYARLLPWKRAAQAA